MDKHYFIELLHKYLKDEATQEEKKFLISYYNLFQYEPEVPGLLSVEKKEELKAEMHDAIWKNISTHEQHAKKIKFINKWSVGIAAAVMLFLVINGLFPHKEPDKKQAT